MSDIDTSLNVPPVNNQSDLLSELAGLNNNLPLTDQEKADLQAILDLLNNPVDGLESDFKQLLQDLQANPPVDPSDLVKNQILPKLQQLQQLLVDARHDFENDSNPAVLQWFTDNVDNPLERQLFGLQDPTGNTLGQDLYSGNLGDAFNIFMNKIADSSFDASYASNALQNLSAFLNSVLSPTESNQHNMQGAAASG